jgi:hypothetical protein
VRRSAWLWAPAAVAFVAAVLGIGVPATHGGHVAVDEPQYLLTALSLAEDGDLDISDELAAQRWRAFHAEELPVQTEPFPDGSEISPHDPLLPLLLAPPMGPFGWVGAKVALASLAAACAALLAWTAAVRFGISRRVSAVGSAVAFASPPLAVYSSQVYPEVPAALATLGAVALLTAPRRPWPTAHLAGVLVAVVALPWLGGKYVPVAAALAAVAAVRLWRERDRRRLIGALAALGLAGVAYLGLHQVVWGGWTVYASGDHFQQTGEFSVVGVDPELGGRTLRTVGLLVDRGYGLVPWQPAWLLLVPALTALVVRRPPGWSVLLAPLAAAWATATWVALTMHGFWWPGRQLVVVLPLAVVAVLWLVQRALPRLLPFAALLGALGVVSLAGLLVGGWSGDVTWVVHFTQAPAPSYRLLAPLLPDYTGDSWLVPHVVWVVTFVALALGTVVALRRGSRRSVQRAEHAGSPF